ncbi:hypothetical protein BGZ96_009825 [Linnemannia gamsii]|uniref:Uncharacterized protein n=1 Tax=Linnemannia gamsii TaxID=64522 RepID=A0ABQ7KDF6_9FUNG|nr:hypothetical protein BGZ96_009825 [Linnemannia gamsii]
MRIPNLTVATVLAIATCIGLVRDAQAAAENPEAQQQPFQIQPESISDVDFTTENHVKFTDCEVVNLVCDNLIIDTIYVSYRPVILFNDGLIASNTHPKSKHCSEKECTNITSTVYINMDKPCSKKPPKGSTNDALLGDASSDSVEVDTASENTLEPEEEGGDRVPEVSLNGDDQPVDEELSLNNKHLKHQGHHGHHRYGHYGHHHHGGHHYNNRHHRNRPHHHRHRHEKEPKHPWLNHCVSVGSFCGTHIFGYRFAANAVYTCDKIGGKPQFTTACVDDCSNGACITYPEPMIFTAPVATTTTYATTETTTYATETTIDAAEATIDAAETTIDAAETTTAATTDTTTITDESTTTAATTTTTSAIATTTTTPDCVSLIEPIKNAIRDLLVTVEKLPLGDEASKLLKEALGTNLTAYFDNGVDSAGAIAATLSSTLSQIEDVVKGLQSSIGPSLEITDAAFQVIYDALDLLIKASSDLAACTGAKPDCTGLITLSGYAIKIGVPILRAYLAVQFPPSVLAFALLQPTIDKIADELIAGNDGGLTEFIQFITDQITGALGSALPAPIKAILEVVKPIIGIIKNCNNKATSSVTGATATATATAAAELTTTTDAVTTITSAIAASTTTPDCTPMIEPIKNAIRGLLTTVEGLPFGPEASQLLKTAIGTNLTSYFDNGVDSAGMVAATLASTIPQIVDVIKGLQTSLGATFEITDAAYQTLYDALNVITKASSDLAACTGAKPDCTGLVVMAGYAIKIGVPILRAYLAFKFPPSVLAFDALQPTIDKIADGLIAGDDAGLTDFLKFITEQTTGMLGAALPAPIKAILDVTTPILNIIKNCLK